MNSALQQAVIAVGSSFALAILAKATFAMALALCAVRLAARKRAAFRHALLAGLFGVLVGLPLVSTLAPPVRIAVRFIQQRSAPTPLHRPRVATSAAVIRSPDAGATARPSRWSLTDFLIAGWLAGAALFLLPVILGVRQVLSLRRSGLPWPGDRPGVEHRVDLLLHEALPGPITCGTFRPAIIFPADAPNWSRDDLDRAMVHELEHVIRRDWPIHCIARAACAFYWFHPLVWIAWRRLELEAERSCDDAVVARSEATGYADQLVAVARRLSSAAKAPLLAMASRADLASRVNAVLDPDQRRGRAGTLCVTVAGVLAAVLVATLSPLRLVAEPQGLATTTARFRGETRLVVVDVKVSSPNGSPVQGLSASDFAVSEDGVRQSISVFEVRNDSYLVGYYPRNGRADGQFRKIEISLNSPNPSKLDYRAGYYATQATAGPPSGPATTPLPGFTPPVLISKKEAEYPEAARRAKYQGTVLLDVQLNASGEVVDIKTLRALGLGLDENATDAVRQWRFKPATKDGEPVAIRTQVEVSFRLL